MRPVRSREQIGARLDELHEVHSGREFAAAVERYSREELGSEERGMLQEILLERAGELDRNRALEERLEAGGWFRRTWKRLDDALDPERTRRRPPR